MEKESCLFIETIMDEVHKETELYQESVLFLNIAHPDWREKSTDFKINLISTITEENEFIFRNSNIEQVMRLEVLYRSIDVVYRKLLYDQSDFS